MHEWISVKDRLPEEGKEVLVFGAGIGIVIATYKKGKWQDGLGDPIFEGNISHWGPLPLSPIELKEGE